jgi:hypothetical protein
MVLYAPAHIRPGLRDAGRVEGRFQAAGELARLASSNSREALDFVKLLMVDVDFRIRSIVRDLNLGAISTPKYSTPRYLVDQCRLHL